MKEIQILNNGDALYDIRRKINENFELVHEKATTEPLVSFGVNEGNETDGVADLLNIDGDTLNFKVGGEYPNLVMTSGDGVTTKIESVNPLHLQNLADGEYKVVVDGSNSNITNAEFYSQLLEPENANNGDVWFNGENALKLENGTINVELMPNTNFTPSFFVSQGDIYVAGGHGYRVLRSMDGGKNWLLVTYDTEADNNTLIGGAYVNGAFYLVGTNKRVYKTETTGGWIFEELPSVNGTPTKFIKVRNNFFVIITTEGAVLRSTDMVTWTINSGWSGKDIADIVYFNNTYYFFTTTGQVYTSTDFSNLEPTETTISAPSRAFVYKNLILIGNQTGGITVYDPVNGSTELIQLQNPGKVNHFHLRQDGGLLVLGGYNICSVTYNLKDFSQIYETGGNLICGDDNFIMGTSGILLKTTSSSVWTSYPYIPVGEVVISDGQVTYFTTYPYNTNGLFEATSSTFGLLRTAAEPDELNCHCQEAVLTPANLYNLNNYRTMNTSYEVDQKVGCPYHHNLQLNCIQAGTTSNEGLNTKGLLEPGTTIEDGTVIWEVQELGTGGGGLEIGDIGIAPLGIDETKGKRRYLNGQIVIQDQYVEFTKKVKSAVVLYPTLACTESEWQTTATMTVGGQVGKFVIDDEAGTIRLPKIIMPIQGLTDLSKLGEIVSAGLPTHTHTRGTMNITGDVGRVFEYATEAHSSGAFYNGATGVKNASSGGSTELMETYFDASRSWTGSTSTGNYSKALANTNTVQQEQIQYPYFIQVATGAETEDNIINEIELNNPFSLLDYKYSEYELNNLSWLRSNGQYNSKAVYPAVYDLLLKIYNGTETKAGVSVKSTEVMKAFKETGSTGYWWLISTEIPKIGQTVYDALGKIVGYIDSITGTNGFTYFDIFAQTYFTTERNTSLDTTIPYTDYDFRINTADETFMLPIKVKLASGKAIKGNGKTLGLTNGTTNYGLYGGTDYGTFIASNLYNTNVGATGTASSGSEKSLGVTTDGSKSGIETSDSDLYLYFYVGETVQNANLINAGRIEETLATKVNMQQATSASFPSSRYIDLTLGASGTSYTAPANGWFILMYDTQATSAGSWALMQNSTCYDIGIYQLGVTFVAGGSRVWCPAKKGDICTSYYQNITLTSFKFVYAVGSESEAQ